ncbi:hypothetical protein GGTG_02425 [Gaeumannomyces tritici R3-111a-1]|uniref:Uncharacterized protein n=1 Tax=Gaeumannomyces tritici (strain R3-111a-1) TaxID=644352 RepID=J3NMC1_GAET3|nr:hypothetical protein GGTG_02425 [Gaeumannomyces tritici R3-111a-1]EJT82452.1 hypothetical protein GGTG_02425 [Gaeumannomyces tritici R3-111a-1]
MQSTYTSRELSDLGRSQKRAERSHRGHVLEVARNSAGRKKADIEPWINPVVSARTSAWRIRSGVPASSTTVSGHFSISCPHSDLGCLQSRKQAKRHYQVVSSLSAGFDVPWQE